MVVGVGRLISSDSIPVGGLTPGAILLDRYRIIGLLGRGGMGEVYRADDLKLGQPVALKFLPKSLSADPVRRERFFAEVRITRQLSHPNICRVYDIAEANGQHFLSMEYIDGEDLASLVKRIGYLSNEKALDIARQLVAGLAAAHERGVLHRDLKPANIMIDGRGRVRITDFGLAIAATDDQPAGDTSGTPAYMAPEQLAGKGASVRSDIYALGLILYEISCGKRAFTATTMAELRNDKEQLTPTAPSEIRLGIDPIVERLVMRCLERDPRGRPASVAQLAAALPGGDPLAAALAAGETPSPELVAASGLKDGLRPAVALALLVFVIAGAIANAAMSTSATPVGRANLQKAPEALADRARDFLKKTGYSTAPVDHAFGFVLTDDLLRFDQTSNRRSNSDGSSPTVFWYRQSPQLLERGEFQFGISAAGATFADPPLRFSGEVVIWLDGAGRLRALDAIPPQLESSPGPQATQDWSVLFSEAGLDAAKWTSTTPQRNPKYYADARAAWEGSLPDAPDVPIRIEAAAYRGQPISFEIIGPWTAARRQSPLERPIGVKIADVFTTGALAFLLGGGLFFASRNLRLGRGDRRGAARLALLMLVFNAATWVLVEHHVASTWEVYLFEMFASGALFVAGTTWVLYIALEPFVRRRWPQLLVSWTRLLSGDWHDPLVGRDVLVGCATGIAVACSMSLVAIAAQWFGGGPPRPFNSDLAGLGALTGSASVVAALFRCLQQAITWGLGALFFLFLAGTLLRNRFVATGVLTLFFSVPMMLVAPGLVVKALLLLITVLSTVPLARFGVLTAMVQIFVVSAFLRFPVTLQASAWYAGIGYAALLVIGAIALFGFRTSLGGRPLLGTSRFEE